MAGEHNRQLTGFSTDEFACPICKSISNSLAPIYGLDDFEDQMEVKIENENFFTSN